MTPSNIYLFTYLFRDEDVIFLFEWILNMNPPPISSFLTTKILYKLLTKTNFQLPDSLRSLMVNVLSLSVGTVFHLYHNIQSFSIECTEPYAHLIISLRIIGNLLATEEWAANYVITNGFITNSVEIASFFKNLLETMDNGPSQQEILWVARNLLENKFLSSDCSAYLQRSGLDMSFLIEYWRKLSNVKM